MGTFTTSVRHLVANAFDFGLTREDYPLWDERYRGVQDRDGMWHYEVSADGTAFYGLNRKILEHFWYYEIGQESPDMFRFMLNRTMREIMPYYNRLYVTEAMIDDPFTTLEMRHHTVDESTTDGTNKEVTSTTGTGTSDSTSRAVNSTFPQTMLANNADYASSATDSFAKGESGQNTEGTSEATIGGSTKQDRVLDITGSQGSRASLLSQYRGSIINVDLMILNELQPLFMQVMDVTDNFMDNRRGYFNGYSYNGFWPYF